MPQKTRKCNDDLFYSCPKKQIDYLKSDFEHLRDSVSSLKLILYNVKSDSEAFKNMPPYIKVSYHGFECSVPFELIVPALEAYVEIQMQYVENVNSSIKKFSASTKECCKKCKLSIKDINYIQSEEAFGSRAPRLFIPSNDLNDLMRKSNKKTLNDLKACQEIKAAKEKLIKIPKYLK